MPQWVIDLVNNGFFTQIVATLIGTGGAGLVAFWLFRAEGRARRAERERDEAKAIQRTRGSAVAKVVEAMQQRLETTGSFAVVGPNDQLEQSLTLLLFEGSQDSYDMYRWITERIEELKQVADPLAKYPNAMVFQLIRSMLIGWVRNELGVMESVRSKNGPPSDGV